MIVEARRWRLLGALGCAGLIGYCAGLANADAQPAEPRELSSRTQTDGDAVAFVVGNIEFLLLHEIAHFLIAEKHVPIIGPEENAADYIATLALLREESLDPARESRALEFLVAAADAFAASWQTGTALGAEVPYWESHALSIQRYYQIACLLYGSDPVAFARVPDIAHLPESRARSCGAEYVRANESIDWLLANYGRQPGDPPGAATDVVYEQAPTLVAARVLRELQSLELLERTLDRLHARFTLDRPFALVLRTCDQVEAAWIPDRRELVICYDLIDTLYLLGLRREPGPPQAR
ncbi:MAG TPA: DUF4344 domain-containing metallopeptidase [Gammaproteobacteria bacterium]|nr:DUF4344 domain-containing metallopeptidase [Gammaproteobacteria bacterium]